MNRRAANRAIPLLAALLLIAAVLVAYLALQLAQASEMGLGALLGSSALLLAALAAATLRSATKREPEQAIRFVPHWFVMAALAVTMLAIAALSIVRILPR
jgi:uncharacterized membrane protein YhdT